MKPLCILDEASALPALYHINLLALSILPTVLLLIPHT